MCAAALKLINIGKNKTTKRYIKISKLSNHLIFEIVIDLLK
jgi:hypothetical protein